MNTKKIKAKTFNGKVVTGSPYKCPKCPRINGQYMVYERVYLHGNKGKVVEVSIPGMPSFGFDFHRCEKHSRQ